MVARYDLKFEQMDVKIIFPHGDLDETIYMFHPQDFIDKKTDYVCWLERSLYELKQLPRQWYKRFDNFVASIDIIRSAFDHCLYFKKNKNNLVIVYLIIYMYDILLIGLNMHDIKKSFYSEFEMKDFGHAKRILGMDIIGNRSKHLLMLNQTSYMEKVLSKFSRHESKFVTSPFSSHFKLRKKNNVL